MKRQIEQAVAAAVYQVFGQEVTIELTRPEARFGDYATNVALQLAKPLGRNPRAVAETLQPLIQAIDGVERADIADPGFLNLWLADRILLAGAQAEAARPLEGQVIVSEYSDPNPFKPLHAGHLYTSVVGDAVSNLLERAGATVHRVNFGGDVGLHAAKAMWGVLRRLDGEHPEKLAAVPAAERLAYLGGCYAAGHAAYEEGGTAKETIITLNKRIYGLHAAGDTASPFARLYWTCRQWSYDGFDAFYGRIGSRFEKYYPESQTGPAGMEAVRAHPHVFSESDGAVVFDGAAHGLHTRVFVTRQGLPTYETKDMGATLCKYQDYHFDQQVIVTGNDIIEYMKVVVLATGLVEPRLTGATRHLTHGNLKLAGGVKMSSRAGSIVAAGEVLDVAAAANRAQTGSTDERTTLGAVKYAFLKQRLGGDIIYDPDESVSLDGNSGPYPQYAHARASSILRKAGQAAAAFAADLQPAERLLVRKLSEYPEVVDRATAELLPHHICTYLYELAQDFNRFYEHNRVLDDPRQLHRLALVTRYRATLADGLELLGITAPDTM